ncbi:amidase [Allomesorhizobium camelthorni]|uniref:Indoleacetamide hydrolase n=1 Tax=Allomesorhizobium camelthorni TaxID=475069 RepID=A0A6G4WDS2_9HYPH|nr:amidase [Mesorhizobium camelthorni]NGO52488.1 amidase [Mesorhizobium camelthorni]
MREPATGSARDRLEEVLARLAEREAEERVFLKLYSDAARVFADAADARRRAGISLGPLDGRIISIKDLFDVAGETTTAGSAALADAPPATRDAVVVARLRRAGAVIVGKTNMTEFAFSGIGLNRNFGTPGNAADSTRVPGGSSSGAGVSVAEGTSEIAIGSDTGGSVRIPAALNGVVGFKPTAGRVPLSGVFPLSSTLDSVGPLARTVADCAIADAIMAGEEPDALEPFPLSGLRIGIPQGRLFGDIDAAVAEGFARSLKALEAAGAKIADHPIDDLLNGMAEATKGASIASVEAAEIHADLAATQAWSLVDPRIGGPIKRRAAVPAYAYIRVLRKRAALAAAMDQRLRPIDVLALPTTPMIAPAIQPLLEDDDLYDRTDGLLLRNPQVANQFDLTAISLPMPGMNLPAGLMLFARNGHDRRLLSTAAAVEELFRRAS